MAQDNVSDAMRSITLHRCNLNFVLSLSIKRQVTGDRRRQNRL